MKKLFIMICAILCTVVVQAQDHMSFKGVSMKCTLTSFVSQLEVQGYETLLKREDGAVLSGSFAGKTNCKIFVMCTNNSKVVWKVVVKFPEKVSWFSLKSEYNTFKETYTSKYGKPESYEFFSSPYYEGDGYELQALKLEKCTYASIFSSPQGLICLEITDDKCVQVVYEDAVNVDIKRIEQNTVVSNDI